jgi:hypothetical protein
MRIFDYETNKAINDVGIFLDREEAQELLAYLHMLVARPELHKAHLSDIEGNRLEREITVYVDAKPDQIAQSA